VEVRTGAIEKFRHFVAWAEPDSKTAFFSRTAYMKQFYPKPTVPMESRDSEGKGVPFASLESL